MTWKTALMAGLGGLALTACAPEAPNAGAATLSELVVTDPSFTFATSKSVALELQPTADVAGGHAVEVTDAEGRRLLKGAVLGGTVVRLPLSAAQSGTLRVRAGRDAAEQTVPVGADDRASAQF